MASPRDPLQLLDLPDEVLISIFSHLDITTLLESVSVCDRIRNLAEPFLYHNVTILNGRQGATLSASLLSQPLRATWVRSFLVSTKLDEEAGLTKLPPFIAQMVNLQDLRLETPDCNSKDAEERVGWISLQDRYERVFEGASTLILNPALRHLPKLSTCTLHFVDSKTSIYSMTRYSTLFLHPNLKSLTISCASTDLPHKLCKGFQRDSSLVKTTRLEHLHLEECDIYPATLAILLSFPRELKSLKISEGVRYDHFGSTNSRMHGNACPALLIQAITEQCSESLESLSLSLGHYRHRAQSINQRGQHLDLTGLGKLTNLELALWTVDLIRVRPVCDHATWRRLPPSLETLKVFSIPLGKRDPFRALGKAYFPLDPCFVRDKVKHGVPALKKLICSYDYCEPDERTLISEDGEVVEEKMQIEIAKNRLIADCILLQRMYEKAGVRLEVDTNMLPDGFIPPYLYPENSPSTMRLWESPSS